MLAGYTRTIPNQLAVFRLVLLPVLWVLALRGSSAHVGVGLMAAGATDMLDGWLARRLSHTTTLGARLDSLSDNLLLCSAVLWVFILEPGFLRENLWLCLYGLGLYGLMLLTGWVRFRRLGNLHLYSTRAAVIVAYLFLIHTFLFPGYSQSFFYATATVFTVASLEIIAVFLTRSRVDERIGSILLRRPRGS